MAKKRKRQESNEAVVIKIDKRKLVSPFNAFKHGKRSRFRGLTCDNCVYGPNGRNVCPFARPGALCAVNEELRKMLESLGIGDVGRSPDALLNALIPIYTGLWEDIMRMRFFNSLEGEPVASKEYARLINVFIKVHDALLRTLVETGKLRKEASTELQGEIVKMFMAVWQKKSAKPELPIG